LIRRVHLAWEKLGRHQAHWSVLTAKKYQPDKLAEHLQEFYATGEGSVARVAATFQRCGVLPPPGSECLEFGCGVGRMTLWLATHFAKVHACDVSAPHLEKGREYLGEQGLHNVAWHHVRSLNVLDDLPKVDVVISEIVLQHNPPPVMLRILHNLLKSLKPGGVAFLQIPTYSSRYEFRSSSYLQRPEDSHGMEMHILPQRVVFEEFSRAGVDLLEVIEDTKVGEGAPLLSNTFVVQRRK
jgi:2-polyprenyl-3-methyl-5-hydroxy-6-metoxy-1,4-benzoquinol methylase